jgi:6-pyruvoyltetrahydropterin/6-carboxytetrahydropterin synthase
VIYTVVKAIDFCYGHRLLNYDGKCRHLHGHNGLLEVELYSNILDFRGMVMDFTDIRNIVKKWVDETLDHKMLLNKEDPVAKILVEMGEAVYLMEDNPTAENIAKHIYEEIRTRGINVANIKLWETASSYASVSAE